MTLNEAKNLLAPAAGAYLGVRASELLGQTGIMAAIAGIVGAAIGLKLAAAIK